MANVFIEESILQDWADFVREKTGTSDKMKPTELLAKTKSEWASGGGSAKKYIVPETTFSFAQSESGLYGYTTENTYQLTEGKTYKVLWDGEEFEFVYTVYTVDVGQIVPIGHALGNASFFNTYSGGLTNFEDTGEPFMIGVASDNTFAILTDEEGESHVVAVYEEKAGGSSDDVRYVTFMSEDGKTELFVKPVAVGDDCVDIVARGLMDEPTKSSTAQYNYTFSGYSLSPGGAADPHALKNVTEDKTLYIAFASALRYYTINYYDGKTLLESESLAYGSIPSYVPEKDGCDFIEWEPNISVVSGNASYTAKWREEITFANASWEQIANASANGTASTIFSVGDVRDVEITATDGTVVTTQFEIVGFNHDDLADGTGKAGISIVSVHSIHSSFWGSSSFPYATKGWKDCDVRSKLNADFYNQLPSDLKNVIKEVNKISCGSTADGSPLETTADKLWLVSASELYDKTVNYVASGQGTVYEKFINSTSNFTILRKYSLRKDGLTQAYQEYYLRSNGIGSASTSKYSKIGDNGLPSACGLNGSYTSAAIGFCI